MISNENRLKVTIKGYFLDHIYKGKYTSLYLFHDEASGTFPIGVDSDIQVEIGTYYVATGSVYGHAVRDKENDVTYSLRMEATELTELKE